MQTTNDNDPRLSGATSTASSLSSSIASKISTDFQKDVVKEALKLKFTNEKNKITDDAIELIKTLTKTLVIEACLRAAKQASLENKTIISLEHVESILPQIMLDFP